MKLPMPALRISVGLLSLLLLAACAPYPNLAKPVHAEGYIQVGWDEHVDADKNVDITVRGAPGTPYAAMLQAAEKRAHANCPQGYRVKSIRGGDEPTEDVLSPNIVIDSEVEFKFRCIEDDAQ